MCRIRFEIVPPIASPQEPIFIVGSNPSLGDWHAGNAFPLIWEDPLHVGVIEVPENTHFEFKVIRGSWESEAVDAWGHVPENFDDVAWANTTIRITVADWKDRYAGRLTHDRIWSERLASPRELLVWLPPEYSQRPGQRFPVVIFFDGDNIFDPATSPLSGVDWAADEWMRRLSADGVMPPAIIVGIRHPVDHGEDGRSQRELDLSMDYNGRAFADFVATELIGYVDSRYRTLANPAARVVCGGSLGGLAALTTAFTHPSVFGRAVCFSTAFEDLLEHLPGKSPVLAGLEAMGQLPDSLRIFFGYGDQGLDACYEPYHQELGGILRNAGWQDGREFKIMHYKGYSHSERSWRQWLGDALTFVTQRDGGTT